MSSYETDLYDPVMLWLSFDEETVRRRQLSLYDQLMLLAELDRDLDKCQYFAYERRCPTIDWREHPYLRSRNNLSAFLGVIRRDDPSNWAYPCYEIGEGCALVYPKCKLYERLSLLHYCDQRIDRVEHRLWEETWRTRRSDENRRALLHDSNYNPLVKQCRDRRIWERNQIPDKPNLPWRDPHDWKLRRYRFEDGRFIVYPT